MQIIIFLLNKEILNTNYFNDKVFTWNLFHNFTTPTGRLRLQKRSVNEMQTVHDVTRFNIVEGRGVKGTCLS